MFSLESPHRGDSNECTQYTIFNVKKKITLNGSTSAAIGFFPRDLRTSSKQPWCRGKRAISVQATEVLLYITPSILKMVVVMISIMWPFHQLFKLFTWVVESFCGEVLTG